jgi:hypothetical protein
MIKTLSLMIEFTKFKSTFTIPNSSLKKSEKHRKLPKEYASGLLLLPSTTSLPRRSAQSEKLLERHKGNLILCLESLGRRRQNSRK